ncbi:MAG TPA: DUF2500 domain-containing protein [Candidatus Luteococcus avicola]|nr:DUF2500 domain-containing protein [Candidatus Luteococcus avicola]
MGIDPFGGFEMFDLVFNGFSVLFALMFLLVMGAFVYRAVRYARAPRMSSPAVCIAKRTQVTGHSSAMGGAGEASGMGMAATGTTSTWYHATFQLPDGQRLELSMDGREYGQLAEGDSGILNWRDDIFEGFQRNPLAGSQPEAGTLPD